MLLTSSADVSTAVDVATDVVVAAMLPLLLPSLLPANHLQSEFALQSMFASRHFRVTPRKLKKALF